MNEAFEEVFNFVVADVVTEQVRAGGKRPGVLVLPQPYDSAVTAVRSAMEKTGGEDPIPDGSMTPANGSDACHRYSSI